MLYTLFLLPLPWGLWWEFMEFGLSLIQAHVLAKISRPYFSAYVSHTNCVPLTEMKCCWLGNPWRYWSPRDFSLFPQGSFSWGKKMSLNGNTNALTSSKAEVPLFLSEFSLSCWAEKLLNELSSAFYVILLSSRGRESTTSCWFPGQETRRGKTKAEQIPAHLKCMMGMDTGVWDTTEDPYPTAHVTQHAIGRTMFHFLDSLCKKTGGVKPGESTAFLVYLQPKW